MASQPTTLSATAMTVRSPVPSSRSVQPAGCWAAGSPTASLTVLKRYPRSLNAGMSRSSAATVCDLSPPASCSSTDLPCVPGGVADATMLSTPLRSQSRLSTSLSAVTYPRCPRSRITFSCAPSSASARDEYGGRTRLLTSPVAPATTSWVRVSSRSKRSADTSTRSGWLNVWMPISPPPARISRSRSGCLPTAEPTTKNVAGTWCRRSTSSTCGVHCGSGPSSNVRTTVRSGMASELSSPCRASITEPPSATAAGTSVVAPRCSTPAASLPVSALTSPWTRNTDTSNADTSRIGNTLGRRACRRRLGRSSIV